MVLKTRKTRKTRKKGYNYSRKNNIYNISNIITGIIGGARYGIRNTKKDYLLDVNKLFEHIKNNNLDGVKDSIENKKVDINHAKTVGAFTATIPLSYAIQYGHLEIVEYLISKGADINYNKDHVLKPIDIACNHCKPEILSYILNKGATIIPNRIPILFKSIIEKKGKTECFTILVKYILDNFKPEFSEFMDMVLVLTIQNNKLKYVKILLDNGINPNIIAKDIGILYGGNDDKMLIPLNEAIILDNYDIVKELIDNGAEVNLETIKSNYPYNDFTPLMFAIQSIKPHSLQIAELLLENGADVNILMDNMSLYDLTTNKKKIELLKKYNTPTYEMLLQTRINQVVMNISKYTNNSSKYLDLSNKGLTEISSFDEGLIAINVSGNNLKQLPRLPASLLYLNCSNNGELKALPKLPKGLDTLICSNCALEYIDDLPYNISNLIANNNKIKDLPYFSENPNFFYILNGNPCPIGFINRYGSITQYSKKRIHRIIEFKDDFVYTMILPKGTVLFRGTSKEDISNNFKGVSIAHIYNYNTGNEEYSDHVLYPNYNVFFYPYPYSSDKIFKNFTDILVYTLERDVEIVMGVTPSPNKRSNRINSEYLKSCNKVDLTSDPDIIGRTYDPCFDPEFIKLYPTIVGIMNLAQKDADIHIATTSDEIFFTKYRSNFIDAASNVGIPEIILYPLSKRQEEQIYSKDDNTNRPSNDELNYSLFTRLKHNSGFYYDDLWSFMEKFSKPYGYKLTGNNTIYHLTIDLATKMFVIYELCDPKIQARCVPIKEPFKFRYLNNNYNI